MREQMETISSEFKRKKISTSKTVSKPTSSKPQTNYTKPKKPQRKIVKKVREINLYSPEYLAKEAWN